MGESYPFAIEAGKKLGCINPIFQVPGRNRKITYTTNIIEALHRQYRKLRNKDHVLPDSSLEKSIFSIYERDEKVDSEV